MGEVNVDDKLLNEYLEIIIELQREKRERDRKIKYLEKELKAIKLMSNWTGKENVKDNMINTTKEHKIYSTIDVKAIIKNKKARNNQDIFKRRVK
ncbi:hypothetical protein [Clostridium beijerinckii]|uniref:Uncharacterized protein n=1 Tax=Clostridium beijerinckii TaxID=1520 RepID=A0AAE5H140_CLOBE|nr:hypothetical protein [Clostridium beijerinckii]NSB12150.1 hypothetical protein [Clostridium beijerinckii]OOM23049.1 hypothetical protein CLOBE_42100 [Clostridium beijerinckii]